MTNKETIYRQDVLDLAKKGVLVSNGNYESMCKAINELPSVTPQPSISQPDIEAIRQEIETEMNLCRMKDTVSKGYKGKILEEVLGKIDKYIQKPQEKWIDEDDNRYICKECEYAHKPQKEPCEDAISRQAVQDYIAKYLSQYLYNDVREAVEVIDEYIGELPSVNPTKTGQWIQTNEFFINQDGQFIYKFICSECKSLSYFRKSNKKAIGANVCPNCGAKMESEEEA